MRKLFVDTNILLCYITGTPEEQAERTYQFIVENTKDPASKLVVADSVITETCLHFKAIMLCPIKKQREKWHRFSVLSRLIVRLAGLIGMINQFSKLLITMVRG